MTGAMQIEIFIHYARIMSPIPSALLNFAGNVLITGVILVAGYFLARVVRTLINKILGRTMITRTLGPSIAQLISGAIYLLILLMTGIVGLVGLGVPDQLVAAIFIIILVAVGFFVFALQQSLSNVAATVIFLLFQPFKRGEVIETMGQSGTVHEILPFNTVLETADHRLVSLPNSKIQDSGIVNYTRLGRIRADVHLMVKYSADLSRVVALIEDVAAQDARILAEPAFRVYINELGERGVKLCAQPTVAPADCLAVQNDLRAAIKSRFEQEGIQFAVYRTDLHKEESHS
jgi:small conductance mechanosensitive channel